MAKQKSKIKVGKFYMIYGGGHHPAYIYEIVVDHKTYKALKFGTTPGNHMIRIMPIQEGYEVGYVHDRPFEGTRKDFGDRELVGLKIDDSDKLIVLEIKQRETHKTKRAKNRYKIKNAVKR